MAEGLAPGTMILLACMVVVVIFISGIIFKKKKIKFKPFDPRPVEKIYTDGLDDKMKMQGKKLKGSRLVIGWDNRNHIDKFYETTGKMTIFEYDDDTKDYEIKMDDKGEPEVSDFDLTIMRLKHNFFIFRWLGFKKRYMLVKTETINRDTRFNRFFLPREIDFDVFANVFTECKEARNYLYALDHLYELQQARTIAANTADRFIHIEEENAKKKSILTTMADIDKKKYEEIKKAEDEVVT